MKEKTIVVNLMKFKLIVSSSQKCLFTDRLPLSQIALLLKCFSDTANYSNICKAFLTDQKRFRETQNKDDYLTDANASELRMQQKC